MDGNKDGELSWEELETFYIQSSMPTVDQNGIPLTEE